jgi:hypothetical protein
MTGDERDVLQYAAASLDEIREHLEKALAATAPALVYVRLALVRDDGQDGERGE